MPDAHTTFAAFGLPLPERTHGLCRPRGGAPEPHTHTPTRVRCLQVGGRPERTHGLCRPRGGAPEPQTHTPTRVRCLQVGGGLGPARCGGQGERGGCGALANAPIYTRAHTRTRASTNAHQSPHMLTAPIYTRAHTRTRASARHMLTTNPHHTCLPRMHSTHAHPPHMLHTLAHRAPALRFQGGGPR